MRCWICQSEANSREHMTKASDLRGEFGSVSQSYPVFMHTAERKNQRVGSAKSNTIKFSHSICAYCNNSRTAPHDRAWEIFSGFLRSRRPPIQEGTTIKLQKVFPGKVTQSMLAVHLFFVKHFGCAITEYKIPIDITPFSEAIIKDIPHPRVFLAIGSSSNMYTGVTDVSTCNHNGRCVFATYFYIIGNIAINVMYSEPGQHRRGLVRAWHPRIVKKLMHAAF